MSELANGEPAPGSLGFWARCAKCVHCWIASYYPAPISVFVKITKRAICPKCGGKAMVAKQEAGVLQEEAANA